MMAHSSNNDDFTIDVGDDIFNNNDTELDFQDFGDVPSAQTTQSYKPTTQSTSPAPPMFTGNLAAPPAPSAASYGGDDYSFESKEAAAPAQATPDGMQASMWQLAYYSPYFDVDVNTVTARIAMSCNPLKKDFLTSLAGKPDLYGPFWVTTTLIVCMGITGNLATVLASRSAEEYVYSYDFTKLTFASTLMYGYILLFPLMIWAFVNFYVKQPCVLLELICLFGYSVFMFIPVSVVCVVPSETLRWTAVVLGFGVSSLVLLGNLYPMIQSLNQKTAYVVLGATASAQILLAVIFKMYFFEYA